MRSLLSAVVVLACFTSLARAETAALTIGETFTVESDILHEVRRINFYAPPSYTESAEVQLPVLYMPDGGIGEDFLHIAGLVQVGVANGTMRPFLLVGIENTQRRRDLTGPTANEQDRKIAPQVGGSADFRSFLRDELIPLVEARYRTTRERAIVGESLAGLFVVETFLLEPDLFDTCIAFDPSLWWNDRELLGRAAERLAARGRAPRTLFLANSREPELADLTRQLARLLGEHAGPDVAWYHVDLPEETHASLYHPAALRAFRTVFGPAADQVGSTAPAASLAAIRRKGMAVRIVRLGTPRHEGEGIRIGTVRRPPRGVPKTEFASGNWYDVWFPVLAPSVDTLKVGQAATTDAQWRAFIKKYRSEMNAPESSHALDLLAALSHATDFSVGCYCEDESHCHRSVLRVLLAERGAAVK